MGSCTINTPILCTGRLEGILYCLFTTILCTGRVEGILYCIYTPILCTGRVEGTLYCLYIIYTPISVQEGYGGSCTAYILLFSVQEG